MRTLNKKTLIFNTALLLLFIGCKGICFDVGKRGVITNIDWSKKRNVFVCEYKASKDTVTIAGETFVLGDAWVEYPWIKKNCEGDIEIQKHVCKFYVNMHNSNGEGVKYYLDDSLSILAYTLYYRKEAQDIENGSGIRAGKPTTSFLTEEWSSPPDTIVMKYKERIKGKEGVVYFVKLSE